MEKLSRVKKYEDLRRSIETDNPVDKKEDTAIASEDTLHNFDSSVLKKVDIKEEYQPEREKSFHSEEATANKVEDNSFTNEYLDDFIKEVREYNIRKGTREFEDTQVDILSQLNAVNRAKRTQYVESIPNEEPLVVAEENKSVLSKEDIALEVANLLRDEEEQEQLDQYVAIEKQTEATIVEEVPTEEDEIVEDIVEVETPIELPEKKQGFFKRKEVQPAQEDEEEEVVVQKEIIDPIAHKKLLEETQQLRVQMDEYEEELTDLSDGVEKTNKLLNFVLCFLILVLLVIIGFIAYSLLKAGGNI